MRAQSSYSAMTLTYIQSSLSPLSAPLPPKMSLGHVWTVCFNDCVYVSCTSWCGICHLPLSALPLSCSW
jgi:hypothetical protein